MLLGAGSLEAREPTSGAGAAGLEVFVMAKQRLCEMCGQPIPAGIRAQFCRPYCREKHRRRSRETRRRGGK